MRIHGRVESIDLKLYLEKASRKPNYLMMCKFLFKKNKQVGNALPLAVHCVHDRNKQSLEELSDFYIKFKKISYIKMKGTSFYVCMIFKTFDYYKKLTIT